MVNKLSLDLSQVENQIAVAKNWEDYSSKIVLPSKLENKISDILLDYHQGLITSNEKYNQILDILNAYYKR
jgi:hypothetical protein